MAGQVDGRTAQRQAIERLPWSVRIPGAVLVFSFSIYTHVVVAALSNVSMATLWERFSTD